MSDKPIPPCEEGYTHSWYQPDFLQIFCPAYALRVIVVHVCLHCGTYREKWPWATEYRNGDLWSFSWVLNKGRKEYELYVAETNVSIYANTLLEARLGAEQWIDKNRSDSMEYHLRDEYTDTWNYYTKKKAI